MRILSLFLALLAALPASPVAIAQTAPKLNLVIVEGDGAINNIRQRTAREPIVEIQDENHKPVAGAVVVFLLPNRGAGGTFADGSKTLTVVSDNQGRAVARGLKPNNAQGQYQIHVSASLSGQTATAVITQTNALGAAGAATGAAAAGISGKVIAVIAVVGAAAVGGGIYAVTHTTNNSNSPSVSIPAGSGITIAAGGGAVGPPR
jgi:hypothetical protein